MQTIIVIILFCIENKVTIATYDKL